VVNPFSAVSHTLTQHLPRWRTSTGGLRRFTRLVQTNATLNRTSAGWIGDMRSCATCQGGVKLQHLRVLLTGRPALAWRKRITGCLKVSAMA